MKISQKIIKRKSGKSKGKWVVRISYFDSVAGKTRYMERHADRKSDAKDLRNQLVDDVRKSYGQSQTGERMTFNNLVDISKRTFYKPAEIIDGKKITGIRSAKNVESQIKFLSKFFGSRLINNITTESLTDYKLWRLKTPSKRTGKPVKITSVNRELSAMRRMMRFAFGNGWLIKDIFFNAKVIDVGSEVERKRILTSEEEIRLLDACQGERKVTYTRKVNGIDKEITATVSGENPHLRAIILLALDSGMRKGEILKLRWQDIDVKNKNILVNGTNTKTERERIVPLSDRAIIELEEIRLVSEGERPFPYKDFRRSFATAKRLANTADLHFHDLRRTAITKWIVDDDIPLALAGKLAGHSKSQTTMKHYVATDEAIVKDVTAKINRRHSEVHNNDLQSRIVNESEMAN